MKVTKHDGGQERMILTAMIVSRSVLSRISDKWSKDGLFPSAWSNIIGGWCVRYYERHRKAPFRQIKNIFQMWAAEGSKNKDTVRLVESYLESLSGQYATEKKKINPDFVVDAAGKYFEKVSLENLIRDIKSELDIGKLKDARKRLHDFRPPTVGTTSGFDLMTDMTAVREAFDHETELVVKYDGDIGKFFGTELSRDSFVAFLAPEKRGKSMWLADVAWRAMLQRKRVVFFEAGDMSKRQRIKRFGIRAARRPSKPTNDHRRIYWPKRFAEDSNGVVVIGEDDRKELKFKEGLSWQQSWQAFEKVQKEQVRSKQSYLKMFCHANSSLTVANMRSEIDSLIRQKWVPDLVVIDYADILSAPAGHYTESRDAINDNWKAMRRMSQELHCCVVTATQANAASYTADKLSMSNFSEDKRKFAHVTAMIGINQTEDEKVMGMQKLNYLVLRDDEFISSRFCYVGQCLALGNPAVISKLGW